MGSFFPNSKAQSKKGRSHRIKSWTIEREGRTSECGKVINWNQHENRVSVKVCEVIFERGLGGVEKPGDLKAFVESQLYKPEYRPLT